MHENMREIEEQIYQDLEIPYQLVNICVGDLGGAAYRKYDLEAWMPGRGDGGDGGDGDSRDGTDGTDGSSGDSAGSSGGTAD